MTSRLPDDDDADGPTFVPPPPAPPANTPAFHRSRTRPARGGSDLLDDAGGHLVAVAVAVFFAVFCPWPVVVVIVVDDDDENDVDEAHPPTWRPPPAFPAAPGGGRVVVASMAPAPPHAAAAAADDDDDGSTVLVGVTSAVRSSSSAAGTANDDDDDDDDDDGSAASDDAFAALAATTPAPPPPEAVDARGLAAPSMFLLGNLDLSTSSIGKLSLSHCSPSREGVSRERDGSFFVGSVCSLSDDGDCGRYNCGAGGRKFSVLKSTLFYSVTHVNH